MIRLLLFSDESLSGHDRGATVGLSGTMALQQRVELRRKHSTASDDWSCSLVRRDGVLRTRKLRSSRPRVQVICFKTGVGREYSFACLAYCEGFCLSNFCLSGSITILRSLSNRLRFFFIDFFLGGWGGGEGGDLF